MYTKHLKKVCFFLIAALGISTLAIASEEDDEMAAMQRQLNAEVMEKPFSVADEKKIDAFIQEAMKKDLKPAAKAPTFWKPGYTCASIYHRGWNHYRSCRYYRRYHGRYWY
ncbi:MAG: hypothetical protein KUG78_02550 [Kangiellaceae bacterium]|nr:hypothetical protein [Kangiellaceae bacterium]